MTRVPCAAILVLVPSLAAAAPVQSLDFGSDAGGFGVAFDATHAQGDDDARDVNGDSFLVCDSGGSCDFLFPAFYTLTAGPLLEFREDFDPVTELATRFYRYGSGTLSLDASLFGSPLHLLTVSIKGLTIGIHDRNLPADPEPHTWVGNSSFADEGASAVLGRGVLSVEFARLVGMPQLLLGGTWEMDIDDIQFHPPSSIAGNGGDNFGLGLSLTVPEPATVTLLAVALVGCRRRCLEWRSR